MITKPIIILMFTCVILFVYDNNQANSLSNQDYPDLSVMAGQMILSGFRGTEIDDHHHIVRDITVYHLGGVILFSYDVVLSSRIRNIIDQEQLMRLTNDLTEKSNNKLLIAIDQEGGAVARLNKRTGFPETVSAAKLGENDNLIETKKQGELIGKILSECNINVNFAPVVDINSNTDNPIIGYLGRSFSAEPEKVVLHAQAFIRGMREYNIVSCLKHFPGHGSSADDSHLGITDVTDTWSEEELIPFKELIKSEYADMIMIGHLVNNNIDPDYPATLSEKFITDVLRNQLEYNGLIISDDLGMKAITDHYELEETIYLALNAGVDILLFGNNMEFDPDIVPKVHETMISLVRQGKISEERIAESYKRIRDLKENIR